MTICEQIAEARGGEAIAGIRAGPAATATDAARSFGLSDSPGVYAEVSKNEARSVLVAILAKDMAYGVALLPRIEAERYADAFLAEFDAENPRYFTNGDWASAADASGGARSWSPATDHTFDAGVLALTSHRVGCVWFMDED